MQINTFSIVAYNPEEKSWAVGVASKFLAVGSLVSWAQAGVGAIATQAYARVGFGPHGLSLLSQGMNAATALKTLLESDIHRNQRQLAIIDANGQAAAHTGSDCHDWAGHKIGEGFACQGNILTGPEVLEAMAQAYITGSGELADRIVAALSAGDAVGGDRRGKQSAAVLVVRPNGGYGGDTDRYLDLRIDDDPDPLKKLKALVQTHHLFFAKPNPEDQIPITEAIASELQQILLEQGYWGGEINGKWDEMSKQAFWALVANENLEERWSLEEDSDRIDRVALEYLRRHFKQ